MVKVRMKEALKYLENIDKYEDDFSACAALVEKLEKSHGLREYFAEGVYYGDYKTVEEALKAQDDNDREFETLKEAYTNTQPKFITSVEEFDAVLEALNNI